MRFVLELVGGAVAGGVRFTLNPVSRSILYHVVQTGDDLWGWASLFVWAVVASSDASALCAGHASEDAVLVVF